MLHSRILPCSSAQQKASWTVAEVSDKCFSCLFSFFFFFLSPSFPKVSQEICFRTVLFRFLTCFSQSLTWNYLAAVCFRPVCDWTQGAVCFRAHWVWRQNWSTPPPPVGPPQAAQHPTQLCLDNSGDGDSKSPPRNLRFEFLPTVYCVCEGCHHGYFRSPSRK